MCMKIKYLLIAAFVFVSAGFLKITANAATGKRAVVSFNLKCNNASMLCTKNGYDTGSFKVRVYQKATTPGDSWIYVGTFNSKLVSARAVKYKYSVARANINLEQSGYHSDWYRFVVQKNNFEFSTPSVFELEIKEDGFNKNLGARGSYSLDPME